MEILSLNDTKSSQQSDILTKTIKGWHPCQTWHRKHRFNVSFSEPPTQVRNVAPWQTLADKVKQ